MDNFFQNIAKRLNQIDGDKAINEDYSPVNEKGEKWIQKAVKHPGGLHRALHVPADEPIPAGKLERATHSSDPKIKKQAVLARTLKGLHKEDTEMDEGKDDFELPSLEKLGKSKTNPSRLADLLDRRAEQQAEKEFDFDFDLDDEHTKPAVRTVHGHSDSGRKHGDDELDEADMEEGNIVTKGLADPSIKVGEKIPGTNLTKTKQIEKDVSESVDDLLRLAGLAEALDTDGVMMTRASNMSSESVEPEDQGEYEREGSMAKDDMHTLVRHAKELETHLKDNEELPTWVIEKLGQIKGMMTNISDYILSQHEREVEKETGEEGVEIAEKITPKTPVGDVVSDFVHSDNPKFAGKSKKQRIDQALAAYYGMHKKKAKAKKEVEETTVAGAVATGAGENKPASKGGMTFGGSVYESFDRQVEKQITESLDISMNKQIHDGEPGESNISITATGEEADMLKELLRNAGIDVHGHDESSMQHPQIMALELDENDLDWPTGEVTLDADPELDTYSGGLNGPKSTGQATAVGGGFGSSLTHARRRVPENVDLERGLFKTWKQYKG